MAYKTEAELQEELIRLQLAKLNKAEKEFIPFVKTVWPEFVEGPHHIKIAKQFERIAKEMEHDLKPFGKLVNEREKCIYKC